MVGLHLAGRPLSGLSLAPPLGYRDVAHGLSSTDCCPICDYPGLLQQMHK